MVSELPFASPADCGFTGAAASGTDCNRAPRASNPGPEEPTFTVHTVPDHHRTRPQGVRDWRAGQRGAWPVYRPCPTGLSSLGQGLPRD